MVGMNVLEAIVLGLVQGLTEFIPVSSSGHLVITQYFFSGGSDHMFVEWIDLGTFIALVVYFRHKIVDIARDVTINKNYRLGRNILLTSIPAGVLGLLLNNFINTSPFFGSIVTVVIALLLVGIVMIILDKLPHLSKTKDGEQLTSGRSFTIGLTQAFALIPGVSRSGSTIIAGRLMGLNAAAAAEYSFLASIPIMFGLILKLFVSSDGRHYFVAHAPTLLLANTVAFISGMFAIHFMISYLSRHGLAVFGWYRVIVASVLIGYLLVK
jgi:undecaprenyl-diphosphatase